MALPKFVSKTVACSVCGETVVKTKPAQKPLCPGHLLAHLERKYGKARAKKYLERTNGNRIKPNTKAIGDLPVRDASHAAPVLQKPFVRTVPEEDRQKKSHEAHADMATKKTETESRIGSNNNQRGSFEDAVKIITAASVEYGEGYRHGWIGNTGMGKTTSIRAFLGSQSGAVTLIHDDTKLAPQYPGAVVERFADAPDDATSVVFRGDVYRGTVVDPGEVADLALDICKRARMPVTLVIDELDRACSEGARKLSSHSIRVCFTQGRALRLSVVWSTQAPQRAPQEVIDQSSTIAIGAVGVRALNYLDDRLCFDPNMLAVIPSLARGEFVLYENGKNWNGVIYETPYSPHESEERNVKKTPQQIHDIEGRDSSGSRRIGVVGSPVGDGQRR